MPIFSNDLRTVTAEEILQICSDHIPEGVDFELKSDLPAQKGRKDGWHTDGSFGEYARNQIAEEIVAFANTLGGVVCIDINETEDHPKRANTVNLLPRVHELAKRLQQAVHAIIDPPLPVLEAAGVEIEGDRGVVLLRVPPSRRRPHRHTVTKEIFVRRNEESVRVTMREVQELTMQAVSEAIKIDTTISKRREDFRVRALGWFNAKNSSGAATHILCVPTTPIDLGRVVGRHLTIPTSSVVASFKPSNEFICNVPWRLAEWRPGLRSIKAAVHRADDDTICSLQTDGTCELGYLFAVAGQRSGAYVGWLMASLGSMLAWTDRIQKQVGFPFEFACAIQILVFGQPVPIVPYGASYSDGSTLPVGFHQFPLISVGTPDEFNLILQRFDEDLWNLAGYDIQQSVPNFRIQ
jgi:hypothetical protein